MLVHYKGTITFYSAFNMTRLFYLLVIGGHLKNKPFASNHTFIT